MNAITTIQNLELWSCEQFAEFLGLKKGTVYVLLCKKQLPEKLYRKVGRVPRFIASECQTWFLEGAPMQKPIKRIK